AGAYGAGVAQYRYPERVSRPYPLACAPRDKGLLSQPSGLPDHFPSCRIAEKSRRRAQDCQRSVRTEDRAVSRSVGLPHSLGPVAADGRGLDEVWSSPREGLISLPSISRASPRGSDG